MKRPIWWAATLVIGVLAIVSFWGGERKATSDFAVAISGGAPPSIDAPSAADIPADSELSVTSTLSSDQTESDTRQESVEPASNLDHLPEVPAQAAANEAVEPAVSDHIEREEVETGDNPEPAADKPEPIEWQEVTIEKDHALTATLSVSAATIWNNLDMLNVDKLEVLPEDGIIFAAQQVVFFEGESVFDLLLREMTEHKIHLEFEMTPIYNSHYIEGIHNLYEFDCGELSGWMYKVNGWFPNYGSSRYALQDGDVVEWVYTCDLGRDVGGYVEGVETGAE